MGSFGQTALNKKSRASVLLSLLFSSHFRLEQWKYIPYVPTILQLALSPSFFVSSLIVILNCDWKTLVRDYSRYTFVSGWFSRSLDIPSISVKLTLSFNEGYVNWRYLLSVE
jgi:hypothetical protein